eukprot:CAMPEP_0185844038 /NCGR_PEP_ID=MMETSP1354-20130828/351_1 /TAXON_ID=708628 /ORGANISM="Erythrolobus madagascarensis, Strain CCMP3276" /LENGTH=531 /DNA_ID=CAMNT_0028543645 /DNA_START=125 /DNA_END=1720 /DNA_ORIENTATION=+
MEDGCVGGECGNGMMSGSLEAMSKEDADEDYDGKSMLSEGREGSGGGSSRRSSGVVSTQHSHRHNDNNNNTTANDDLNHQRGGDSVVAESMPVRALIGSEGECGCSSSPSSAPYDVTILVVIRGDWCSGCRAEIKQWAELELLESRLTSLRARLLFVSSQLQHETERVVNRFFPQPLFPSIVGAIGDPRNTIASYLRDHRLLDITVTGGDEKEAQKEQHEQQQEEVFNYFGVYGYVAGMMQPAVLVYRGQMSEVLYEWASVPGFSNLDGAIGRPDVEDVLKFTELKVRGRGVSRIERDEVRREVRIRSFTSSMKLMVNEKFYPTHDIPQTRDFSRSNRLIMRLRASDSDENGGLVHAAADNLPTKQTAALSLSSKRYSRHSRRSLASAIKSSKAAESRSASIGGGSDDDDHDDDENKNERSAKLLFDSSQAETSPDDGTSSVSSRSVGGQGRAQLPFAMAEKSGGGGGARLDARAGVPTLTCKSSFSLGVIRRTTQLTAIEENVDNDSDDGLDDSEDGDNLAATAAASEFE